MVSYNIRVLKPETAGRFFVFEEFWGVEGGDFGGVPGGEYFFVVANDGDQVVVALGGYLDVAEQF